MGQLENVCVIIPDISQGMPLVELLNMSEVSSIFFKKLPLRCFLCSLNNNLKVYLTCLNTENISQETISLLTIKTIEELSPDLVISLDICEYIGDSHEMLGKVCVVNEIISYNVFNKTLTKFNNVWENSLKIAKLFELPYMKIMSSTSKDLPRNEYDLFRYTNTNLRDSSSSIVSSVCEIYKKPILVLRGISKRISNVFEDSVEVILNKSTNHTAEESAQSIQEHSNYVKNMSSVCKNILEYISRDF